MWTVAAAVSDGTRSGASWLCLGPAVRGKRWWCLWCRYWTGPVDPLSLLKVRALWIVALRLVRLMALMVSKFGTEDKELLWLRRCGLLKAVNRRGLVIVGCDRCWCKIVDRSVRLMCRSFWWWVCRCDCLRRRWRRGAAAEDRRWTVFFCNQNSTLFFRSI